MQTVRAALPTDHGTIDAVERAAFRGADEARLTRALRAAGDIVHELVAETDGVIDGHVVFSRMTVQGASSGPIAALGPVAVSPAVQRHGIGSALIREGIARLRANGYAAVFVLGHAAYYPRFGFSPEAAAHVASPYAGPHFMALELTPGALKTVERVDYSPAFASGGGQEH